MTDRLKIPSQAGLRTWYEKQDKLSLGLSVFVFLVTFVAYLKTMAPTASFWDCGEFVACSYILGVPHPPGTPLFVLIGRIFSVISLYGEIAARVNFISVLSSALAVWLCYILIVKLVSYWQQAEPTLWMRIGKYVGAVAGSLFLAFSTTFWSNAVEAEVYGASMFLMLLILYLGLLWMDKRKTPKGTKLLILMSYLGFLSLGIHMTTFIIMPAIFLLVILVDRDRLLDWRFWITGLVLMLVMQSVEPFLFYTISWFVASLVMYRFGKNKELTLAFWLTFLPFSVITAIVAHFKGSYFQGSDFFYFYYSFLALWVVVSFVPSNEFRQYRWGIAFSIILAAMMAYTVQLFIPIRSSLDPAIDENDPDDWPSFKGFLERKQYGTESMIGRMFYRRGTWANQFGAKERMGFWGFFREQFMDKSLWFIPVFLGLFGIWEQIRRRNREGVVLLFLLFACTVGLVLYMNFADGTKPDKITGEIIHIEVRDRDYFFSPGFMFFALSMGLGISALLASLGSWLEKTKKILAKPFVALLSLIILALPIFPAERGFTSHNNRSNNYLPYDYAYNLLNSCDENAILFTNGDNDTFPLWFLQNVEKIRLDVRVVNLSLINTNWYIKQMKNQWGVPISLTDNEIDRMGYVRTKDGRILRIQDQMIDNIMKGAIKRRIPVYFAVTVAGENRVYKGNPIDDNLRMEGMAYRVVEEEGKLMVEPDIMRDKLFNVFRFRGVSDPKVHKDENDLRLLANYTSCFLGLADTLRRAGQFEEAIEVANKVLNLMPYDWKPYAYLLQLYAESNQPEDSVQRVLQRAEVVVKENQVLAKEELIERLYFNLGYSYKQQGDIQKAKDVMNKILTINKNFSPALEALASIYHAEQDKENLHRILETWKDFRPAMKALADIYYNEKDKESLEILLETWMENNPDDAQTMGMLNQIKSPGFEFMQIPSQP